MILKLRNKKIFIEDNRSPEDIHNANIKYDFELGTNHLYPILMINDRHYEGDNIYIDFNFDSTYVDLCVLLCDGNNTIIHKYTGEFVLYKTFTLGEQYHIDVYKELVEAKKYIKYLEEKGDII